MDFNSRIGDETGVQISESACDLLAQQNVDIRIDSAPPQVHCSEHFDSNLPDSSPCDRSVQLARPPAVGAHREAGCF